MTLNQKTIFSSSETLFASGKIIQIKKSFLGKSEVEIPFESIDFQSEIKRNHIEAPTAISVISICLFLIIVFLNKFKIYSNEDMFVVLSGLLLILIIGFRVLQMNYKRQIVIPTYGLGEVIIWQDRPSKEVVDRFMIELKLAIIKHYKDRSSQDLDSTDDSKREED